MLEQYQEDEKNKALWKHTKNNNLDNEFPFKNDLDYKIKTLKLVFFFNNFSGDLYFVLVSCT